MRLQWILAGVLSLLALACADKEYSQPTVERLHSDEIATIALEVDYLPGAEPYTGPADPAEDVWNVFRFNGGALFPNKEIVAPSLLSEMEALEDQGGGPYTSDQILEIAGRHRDLVNTADRATFYVLFLDGFYMDEEGEHPDVVSGTIGHTGVIALFKPAIEDGDEAPYILKWGEQAALIKGFGHGAGLVNRGIPMVSNHEDSANPHDCTNPSCIMHHLNDRRETLMEAVDDYIATGNTNRYGPSCMADVQAFSGR